ncbi:nuclear condensing complex subunit [Pisolithus orientalis]|uniref:nuclear condensing complex subunit n=1 Tax=Pisolithus orientalis TaxID=936130 RepID=UPI00222437B9|nr:nuclear condensing complex subunit [Pisolithus orientalis]KAI6000302.1 nuclear condensing complex subunit [Pisolithus orientalis]
MPARTNPPAEALSVSIPKIFDQAQNTTANHQKNIVALHKIHLDAAAFTESVHNGKAIKLTGERNFEDAFIDMVCRVLVIKKGVSQAERIVKFIGTYTKYLNEKGWSPQPPAAETKKEDEADDDDDDDTTASRFVARLLKFLVNGFVAKDKVVRYRSVRILAEMVAHLGEIDEDVYMMLRAALIERVHDKETNVRVQAVVALSKLCGSEDTSDVNDDEPTAIDVLLDTLACDPAAEVRRAALLNIPLAPHTLPAMLARTRDTDTVMRKLTFSQVLEKNCLSADHASIGAAHPRVLPAVRAAAGSLLGTWVDVARGPTKAEDDDHAIRKDVIALLKLLDLHESTIAEDALLSIFATRVDIFEHLEFKEDYWRELTPERTFLARIFVEHCIATKDDAKLDASLPVVTHLAFQIQNAYNAYLDDTDTAAAREHEVSEEQLAQEEDARLDQEFIIGELLRLAVSLDYADEMGRRKMFKLVRDMISQDVLPESLVSRCLDILRTLSPNERDLIRVVVEVVHELRDRDTTDEEAEVEKEATETATAFGEIPSAGPSSTQEGLRKLPKEAKPLSPEEQVRADALDLRCLSLCIGMLERVNGTFEENSTLEGILGELIIPSVKRKELALREKGLVCLGLCCLIARRMALNSFQLFLSQIQAAPEVLKIRVLQIVFDILMVHDGDFLGRGNAGGERIVEFLLHILSVEDADKVQALMCVGLAKLVLSGIVSDDRVLKSLVVAYLSPDTVDNQELRQCLSYFFPVFCCSSSVNQRQMMQVRSDSFAHGFSANRMTECRSPCPCSNNSLVQHASWKMTKRCDVQGQKIDNSVHVDLAADIMKALFKDGMEKEDKKVLCQVLGRLHLPDTADDDKIRTIKLLIHNLGTRRPLRDTAAKNALAKFDASLSKKYADKLADFSEEEYRQLAALKDLFEFLDDIIPIDEDEEIEFPKTRARKRRSRSMTTDTVTSGAEEGSPATSAASSSKPRSKGKGKQPKRRRVSGSDDDCDDHAPDNHATSAPTRILPKRAASVKKPAAQPIIISDDDDDDEDEEHEDNPTETTPVPSSRKRDPNQRQTGGKTTEDHSAGNTTFDSIMDSGDEDEEGEVDDILAED